ncbi:DNA helicase Pif1 like protein, partial [Phakopsora pachyrhizi]
IFIDGPGSTGKTYLLNCILNYCSSKSIPFKAVASSGVPSLLLLNGKTAHLTFKIPLKLTTNSVCGVFPNSSLGNDLMEVKFILWDEISMQHRNAVKCVNRLFQSLLSNTKFFGGVNVI